jgi:hypothetical protein
LKFAQFLVEQKIDSISLNPDTVLKTVLAFGRKNDGGESEKEEGPTADRLWDRFFRRGN